MKHLSAETLLEIVRTLRSDSTAGQRRKQPRVGLRHSVRLIPCDLAQAPMLDKGQRAWVRDVSRRGLGLLAGQRFDVGQTVLLEIATEKNDGTAHLLGRIARCEELTDQNYHVGVELILDTPQDVLLRYSRRVSAT